MFFIGVTIHFLNIWQIIGTNICHIFKHRWTLLALQLYWLYWLYVLTVLTLFIEDLKKVSLPHQWQLENRRCWCISKTTSILWGDFQEWDFNLDQDCDFHQDHHSIINQDYYHLQKGLLHVALASAPPPSTEAPVGGWLGHLWSHVCNQKLLPTTTEAPVPSKREISKKL